MQSERVNERDGQGRGWWRARPRTEASSPDSPARLSEPVANCVICSTLGGHSGGHYTAQQLIARFHVLRVTDPGKKWVLLPEVRGPGGYPILASLVDLGLPKSHFVTGCWLCEQTPDVELSEVEAAAAASRAADVGDRPRAQQEPSLRRPTQPASAEAPALAAAEEELPALPADADAAAEAGDLSDSPLEAPLEIKSGRATSGEPAIGAESAAQTGMETIAQTGLDGSHDLQRAAAPRAALEEEAMPAMDVRGFVRWDEGGLAADVRTSAEVNGHGPRVEDLKDALRGLDPPALVDVSLTETLGRGDAWVSVRTAPGNQGKLLICLGQIVELLVDGGAYAEVALAPSAGA